jgi:hypothetical protein
MRLWLGILPTFALVGYIMLIAPACGQGVQLTQGTYMGKVVGVRGTNVLIKSNNGISVIASLDPERRIGNMRINGMGAPHVEVTGTLLPDNLQKGMCVRFPATLQGSLRRTATEPVKQLDVFTPDQTTQFGLLADNAGAGGVGADNPAEPKKYLVVGSITSVRSGMMTVEFPGGTTKGNVKAKVADDAVINLKSNRLYAPPGAEVTVDGMQVQGGREPVNLLVKTLTIKLPPPPPPKSKIAGRPKSNDGDAAADPFDKGNVGEDGAAAAGEPKSKVPGKIVKIN